MYLCYKSKKSDLIPNFYDFFFNKSTLKNGLMRKKNLILICQFFAIIVIFHNFPFLFYRKTSSDIKMDQYLF